MWWIASLTASSCGVECCRRQNHKSILFWATVASVLSHLCRLFQFVVHFMFNHVTISRAVLALFLRQASHASVDFSTYRKLN